MSTDLFRRYGNLLRPDGTNQLQRLLPALEADYIVPDERDFSALVEYAQRILAEVRYYDLSGQATGDWQALLQPLTDDVTHRILPTAELERRLATRADWPPHLVLFLVFVRLFQHLQGDLNQLPQKHLLHYYEKHLRLMRRPAANDSAHVLFELVPTAPNTRLPAGTLLDAGKDALGRPLRYATQNELVVSKASVAAISRLVMQRDLPQRRRFFVADSIAELEAPGFATFGAAQLEVDASRRFMHEAPLGFAVAAPVLQLAEGMRAITLRAHLNAPAGAPAPVTQGISDAVEISVTGAEGWLSPDSFTATLLANGGLGRPALLLTMTVSAEAPAIVAADPVLHGVELSGERAAVRCLVRGEAGGYELFDGYSVHSIDIDVDVQGVHNLVVQNDESTLVATKPMPLFGAQPRIGSTFYIGSAEVFGKRLTGLDIHYEWKAPPEDLFDHYSAYFDDPTNELSDTFYTYFRADVDLLYQRVFRPLLVNQTLFDLTSTSHGGISANASAFDSALGGQPYAEQPDLLQPEAFDGTSRFGFVRLVLTNPKRSEMQLYSAKAPFEAFGHPVFPARYAVQAIALSDDPDNSNIKLPKEPYTPVLSSLTLDYSARTQILASAVPASSGFFVVGPFGARRAGSAAEMRLVPAIDGIASLFLGVANLDAPANLSLLFQIDAGTASGTQVLRKGDTEWSYLDAQDLWQPLASSAILIDDTEGFQSPGVVSIAVPREASVEHRSMPTGLVWLRALIRQPPESAARTLSVRTQAALAVFQPGPLPLSDYADHLESPLPQGTITNLVPRNAGIKAVEQPVASFGGRGNEVVADFVRRSSERLRHRNRAVTPWDLERLVLERFPDVFKLKCLSHTDETGGRRAGHTAVVVVPNLRGGGTNLLEPRAGEVLLGRIDEYLNELVTPFAELHVIRPAFERIRVEARVVFVRGRDPGYFAAQLNEDLRRFLSPWAYEEGEDIVFGARIYRSEVLAFIEGRDYVDHIIGLRIYHRHAGDLHDGIGSMIINFDFVVHPTPKPTLGEMVINDDFIVGTPFEAATTTEPHAILVSHPDHLITPVAHGAEICSGVTRLGIGRMTVGLDFEIEIEDFS